MYKCTGTIIRDRTAEEVSVQYLQQIRVLLFEIQLLDAAGEVRYLQQILVDGGVTGPATDPMAGLPQALHQAQPVHHSPHILVPSTAG